MNKPEQKDFPPESPHDLEWGGYNHEKYSAALKHWESLQAPITMSKAEIKDTCTAMYAKIKFAEDRLKEVRGICKHPETFEGNWSYRIGSISPAIICSDCGALMRYIT